MINLSRCLTSLDRFGAYKTKRSLLRDAAVRSLMLAALLPVLAAASPAPPRRLVATDGPIAAATPQLAEAAVAATSDQNSEPEAESKVDVLQQREQELEQLRAHLDQLRADMSDNLGYRDALLDELRQFEQDVDALTKANRQLAAMVKAQRETVMAVETRLAATRIELRAARAELAELVRTAYAMGRGDQVRLLLGQDDPRRAERLLGYYLILSARRAAQIEAMLRLERSLQGLEQREREEARRLARLAARQVQTRERLMGAQRARQTILSDLEQAIAADQARALALAADAKAMQGLIEQLKREAEIADEVNLSLTAINELQGELAWPLAESRILRTFGEGREQGALHADGVLLATHPGAEVVAVHHGRVAYAGWLRGFGMLIVIDHGDGYLSLYGHNQALMKDVGEWVAAGDLIALAGDSGGTGSKGLYFAIRRDGRAIDPARWCQAAGR